MNCRLYALNGTSMLANLPRILTETEQKYAKFAINNLLNDATINNFISNVQYLFSFTHSLNGNDYTIYILDHTLLTNEILNYCLTLNDMVIIDSVFGGDYSKNYETTDLNMCHEQYRNYEKGLSPVPCGVRRMLITWLGTAWNNAKPILSSKIVEESELDYEVRKYYFRVVEDELNSFTEQELNDFATYHYIELQSQTFNERKTELINILIENKNLQI